MPNQIVENNKTEISLFYASHTKSKYGYLQNKTYY